MAHSNSAKKRIRQNVNERARNRWRMGTMRTSIKDLGEKLMHGTPAEAQEAFQAACKLIDRTASKGVIHKNQAARRKSRLAARLRAKVEGKAMTSKPAGSRAGGAKAGGAKAGGAKPAAKSGGAKPAAKGAGAKTAGAKAGR